MIRHTVFSLAAAALLFQACTGTDSQEGQQARDTLIQQITAPADTLDSLLRPRSIPAVPQLAGIWLLTEIRMDHQELKEDIIGNTRYVFSEDSTLTLDTPDLGSSRSRFSVSGGKLSADALPQPMTVEELTDARLVLLYQVDGSDIRMIFKRER
ncbi:MAG: hypothetical protein NW241_21380 [Bacteroidia bacterium]|nr:hypothetical protein [Bacteroidia bacterium]